MKVKPPVRVYETLHEMKRIPSNLLFAAMVSLPLAAVAQPYPHTDPGNAGGWVLLENMSDEFDGTELDETKWLIQGVNGEFQSNFRGRAPSQFSTNNVRVEAGMLKLETRWEPNYPFNPTVDNNGDAYTNITTAAVITRQQYLYGYMEIRSKSADADITSSFWTTGLGSELDVFESTGRPAPDKQHLTNEMWSSIHDWSRPRPNSVWTEKNYLPFGFADGFHTYGCEWDENNIKLYADGQLITTVTQAQLGTNWVMDVAQWIWVDQETFIWRGLPVESDLPVDYEIEYIRVWQKPPNSAPAFTIDPIHRTNTTENVSYTDSISTDASDPDGDPMIFSKVSGPGWLSVMANGALSGWPSLGNVGTNVFAVQVDATGGSDVATLNVLVNPGPWSNFISLHGLSGVKTNNSDLDTLSDWDEYVLGGNPTNPAYIGVLPAFDTASGEYTYRIRNDAALLAHVLTKTNLLDIVWSTNETVDIVTNDGTIRTNTAVLTTSDEQLYVTLLVEDTTPPNQAPAFVSDSLTKMNATRNEAYTGSIAGDASDTDGDPMTFSKLSGPGWLSVAANGVLSGMPGVGDVGTNAFSVEVIAPGGSDAATLNIAVDASPVIYPASQGNNVSDEWIGAVTIGSISRTSGVDGGYYDGTSISATVTKGESVSVSLVPEHASTIYNEVWRVWIDLNHDGDFADSGEEVFGGSGTVPVTGSFTLPSTYSYRGSTRMRVSMRYANPPPSDANFDWGEVEDYTLIIQ